MTATDIIKIICPNLYNDSNLTDYINYATIGISSCFFGSNYQKAIALKASHIYALAQRSMGAAGSISSMKEGDLSLSYAVGSNNDDLSQTNYGRQYQQLINNSSAAITVTGNDDIYCSD